MNAAPSVISLKTLPIGNKSRAVESRLPFRVIEFNNPRTGSISYRVDGAKRDGTRVRKNFAELSAAQAEQQNLNTEWLSGHTVTAIRSTTLTEQQTRFAEAAFARLPNDADLLSAVEHWLRDKPDKGSESPRLDDAVKQFTQSDEFTGKRHQTKRVNKVRLNAFANSVPNVLVRDITADVIDAYLAKRNVSIRTKINDLAAVSAFLQWCTERRRKWLRRNPCREVSIAAPERGTVPVLSVEQCGNLLAEAESYAGGRLLPHVVLTMFAGLRPFEAQRCTPDKINLVDREINITAEMTKTKRPRVVRFGDGPEEQEPFNKVLWAWLKKCEGKPIVIRGFSRRFSKLIKQAGLAPWVPDILRHGAISNYFRLVGSYGLTAETFGNSEKVIRDHYQGRVNSEDAKAFYALMPKKGGRK